MYRSVPENMKPIYLFTIKVFKGKFEHKTLWNRNEWLIAILLKIRFITCAGRVNNPCRCLKNVTDELFVNNFAIINYLIKQYYQQ